MGISGAGRTSGFCLTTTVSVYGAAAVYAGVASYSTENEYVLIYLLKYFILNFPPRNGNGKLLLTTDGHVTN